MGQSTFRGIVHTELQNFAWPTGSTVRAQGGETRTAATNQSNTFRRCAAPGLLCLGLHRREDDLVDNVNDTVGGVYVCRDNFRAIHGHRAVSSAYDLHCLALNCRDLYRLAGNVR